eukprot:PITA_19056
MQLDLAKAYDKLNWTYIRRVLIAFGFDHNWVRWVMALVTSSSFSILVDGSPFEIFIPSRGLRQGDPLSPFLFILMMERLGRSIKQAKVEGKIKGLQLSRNGRTLTHQQFVDDTMLQGVPTIKEALAYKQLLNDFGLATGMEVNLFKSKIFFFNTDIAIQRNISRILIFQRDSLPLKYLGVPLTAKPLHKSIWEHVINKMQDKIRNWTIRSLNLAGRLVLTKVVLQYIPVFMLSALPAPIGVLQQLKTIQRDFLWEVLSRALGAKLWWKWVKDPKAQWASIWTEKYANTWDNNNHIRMSRNIKGLYIWNKAWENRGLVQNNSFWEIREGDLALFWEDKWQQEPILLKEEFLDLKRETNIIGLSQVKDFWDQNNNASKWRKWRNMIYREDNPLKTKVEALM